MSQKMKKKVSESAPTIVKTVNEKLPRVVYGLDGICEIFNVSKTTACHYHKNIIKDACTKKGKVIVVDVKKALELFGCTETENFF